MATIYLNADTGDNTTGDGTSGNPYETIAKGIAETTSGDTIYMQNSTANFAFGAADLALPVGVDLEGESQAGVTVERTTLSRELEIPDGSIVKNFEVTWASQVAGNIFQAAENATAEVQNILWDNVPVAGISNTKFANSTLTFTACKFIDCGPDGTFLDMIKTSVAGTLSNWNNCLFYWSSNDFPSFNTNTIINTSQVTGIQTFTNCIFYSQRTASIELGDASQDASWVFNNCLMFADNGFTNVPTGNNNLELDPLMVDAANGDYNLRPTSPCIDAGTLV